MMKKTKNNVVAAIVAVATIAGFSAFKLSEKTSETILTTQWFSVSASDNDTLEPQGNNAPENCDVTGNEHCAIKVTLDPNTPNYPSSLSEAQTMEAAGELSIDEELFRP